MSTVHEKMKAICDNIRLRTGGTELLTLDDIAEAILTIGVNKYTNQVPKSIDTDKSVYNGKGYMDGQRLSSSGSAKAQTYSTVTGFIPAKSGDIIRIKGYKWYDTSQALNYLCAYNSSFDLVGAIVAKGTTYTTNPISSMTGTDEEATLTIANNSNIAYVRISVYEASNASLTGANLIVTVNEEITD